MRKIVFLTLTVTSIALTGFWGFGIGSKTYDEELFVKVEENWLCKLDCVTGETQKIFKITKWSTRHLSVSPHSKFIAFIETEEGTFEGREYKILPKSILTVLDPNGKTVRSVENVQRYTWSPDGSKIAYITGTYYEGGVGFKTTGVWMIDVGTGEQKQIEKELLTGQKIRSCEGGYEIFWAKYDGNIYVKDFDYYGGVYRFNPVFNKIESTNYHDIYFSPDGMYYYYLPHPEVGSSIELYERDTNKSISNVLPKDLGSLSGWVFNRGHFLLFTKKEVITRTEGTGMAKRIVSQEILDVQNFIFDVKKKKVIKQFDGQISSWIGNGNKIVVEREAKIAFEEIPEDE